MDRNARGNRTVRVRFRYQSAVPGAAVQRRAMTTTNRGGGYRFTVRAASRGLSEFAVAPTIRPSAATSTATATPTPTTTPTATATSPPTASPTPTEGDGPGGGPVVAVLVLAVVVGRVG